MSTLRQLSKILIAALVFFASSAQAAESQQVRSNSTSDATADASTATEPSREVESARPGKTIHILFDVTTGIARHNETDAIPKTLQILFLSRTRKDALDRETAAEYRLAQRILAKPAVLTPLPKDAILEYRSTLTGPSPSVIEQTAREHAATRGAISGRKAFVPGCVGSYNYPEIYIDVYEGSTYRGTHGVWLECWVYPNPMLTSWDGISGCCGKETWVAADFGATDGRFGCHTGDWQEQMYFHCIDNRKPYSYPTPTAYAEFSLDIWSEETGREVLSYVSGYPIYE